MSETLRDSKQFQNELAKKSEEFRRKFNKKYSNSVKNIKNYEKNMNNILK